MITDILILVVSLYLLVQSANVFIDTSIFFAKRLHVSTMIIGLTIVSIGTSLPELAISAAAALKGHSEIALGNVVGSNICNIGVIMGITALVAPIKCSRDNVQSEGFLMLGITIAFWILSSQLGAIPPAVGIVYVIGFFGFMVYLIKSKPKDNAKSNESDSNEDSSIEIDPGSSMLQLSFKFVLSLIVILLSSEFMIRSTVSLARAFNVAEHVIALSMIAFGTSLPELSVSIAAIKKDQGDILVGNIIGSNISNILLILGVTSLIQPIPIDKMTLKLDYTMMAFLSALLILFLHQKNGINRGKGIVFLTLYGVVLWRCFAIS